MAIIYGNAISIGYATSGSSVGGIYSIWLTLPAVATSVTFTAVKGDVSIESKYISSIKAAKITLPADNPEGDWTITGTVGGKTVTKTVTVKSGTVDYFVDFRNDFIPLVGDLAVGNLVTFDNKEWRVVHQEGTHWYLAAKDIYSITSFSTGNLSYKNSTLANVAATYESEQLSTTAKEYCIDVTVENVTAKVFVPNYNWVNGGFEYYNSNTNRICNYNGVNKDWWASSFAAPSQVYRVRSDGTLYGTSYSDIYGFRPHICIDTSPSSSDTEVDTKISSGKYTFKNTLTSVASDVIGSFVFSTNSINMIKMVFTAGNILQYWQDTAGYSAAYDNTSWRDSTLKTVILPYDATVDTDFYAWFTSNTTKQI